MSRTENIDMRDLTCQDTVVNFSRTRLFQKKTNLLERQERQGLARYYHKGHF